MADYSNENFTWTQSIWWQPQVDGDSNYSDYQTAPAASFWCGTGMNDLIQCGCDSIATATPQYRCWTQDFPYENTVWEGPVVHAGDEIFATEQYEGGSEAYYYLENVTTGKASAFTNYCPDVGYTHALFINERMNGLYLPDFASTDMDDNQFGPNDNVYTLNSAHNNKTIMNTNGEAPPNGGTVMSEPGAVNDSTGDFTQYWYFGGP